MNQQRNTKSLDLYLRSLFKSKDPIRNPFDEWITILLNLDIFGDDYPKSETYPNGATKIVGVFSLTDAYCRETYKEWQKSYINTPQEYPFNHKMLKNLLSISFLSIGNAELGETVRINHIEPLRYFYNLEELIICCNTVETLSPIWNLPNLKRVWIESTLIPTEERVRFRHDHPHIKLKDQICL